MEGQVPGRMARQGARAQAHARQPHHSPLFQPRPCRAPGVDVVEGSVTDSSANVAVTAPSSAPEGGWERFDLTVCSSSGCSSPAVQCKPVVDPGTTTCAITGLMPAIAYTVEVEAVAGTLRSQTGSDATLVTRMS